MSKSTKNISINGTVNSISHGKKSLSVGDRVRRVDNNELGLHQINNNNLGRVREAVISKIELADIYPQVTITFADVYTSDGSQHNCWFYESINSAIKEYVCIPSAPNRTITERDIKELLSNAIEMYIQPGVKKADAIDVVYNNFKKAHTAR